MRFSKSLLSFLVLSVFSATCSLATTYSRGDLRPSGNGVDCATVTPGSPCVGGSGTLLSVGEPNFDNTSTILTFYKLLEINGVVAGQTITFGFANFPDATQFGVVGCGDDGFGNIGIFTSVGDNLNLPCTKFPGTTGPASFISETDDIVNKSIKFQFFGQDLPPSWTFSFLSDSQGNSAFSPTSVVVENSNVPEPASLSLVALGLAAFGLWRRKTVR